jgi:uncharacterized membrane protein
MTGFLLAVHVIAAIVAIGPVTIAASMFPPALRAAVARPADGTAAAVPRVLHRITRVYAVIGIVVPVFGVATAVSLRVLGDAWLITSMILTGIAAAVLVGRILPDQRRALRGLEEQDHRDGEASPSAATGGLARRLGMTTGVFNLLWATVVVLMIYRPGSTTGVGS